MFFKGAIGGKFGWKEERIKRGSEEETAHRTLPASLAAACRCSQIRGKEKAQKKDRVVCCVELLKERKKERELSQCLLHAFMSLFKSISEFV